MDDDSGSEETGSEIRDDQTDTSSAEVPSTRPRRAVTLWSSVEAERRAPVERSRRARRAPAAPQAEGAPRSPATSQEAAEVKRGLRGLACLVSPVEIAPGALGPLV